MSQSSSTAWTGTVNFGPVDDGNKWVLSVAIAAAALVLAVVLFKRK